MTGAQKVPGQWIALAYCFLATVGTFLPYVGYTTQTAKMMADLHMDYTMVGTLASVTALSSAISVFFAGAVIDRIGAKTVCVASLLLAVIGQIWFATADSYQTMLLARIFQGATIPLVFVAPYAIAMKWARLSNRMGIFMGIMLATDGIGTLISLYGYALVLNAWGWRIGSLWGAGALLILALLQAVYLKEPKAHVDTSADRKPTYSFAKGYLAVMKMRNVIVAALLLTGAMSSFVVAVYWVPTLLIEEGGWSQEMAGLTGALYPAVGIISALASGVISDRIGRLKPLLLVSGLGMTLSFMGAAFAVSAQRFGLLAATLPLAGFFAYVGAPLAYVLALEDLGVELAGRATGFVMGAGLAIGGVISPLVLGYVRDVTGLYTVGFIALAGSNFLTNFIAVFFSRHGVTPNNFAQQKVAHA